MTTLLLLQFYLILLMKGEKGLELEDVLYNKFSEDRTTIQLLE
jgi:hypothetical protein